MAEIHYGRQIATTGAVAVRRSVSSCLQEEAHRNIQTRRDAQMARTLGRELRQLDALNVERRKRRHIFMVGQVVLRYNIGRTKYEPYYRPELFIVTRVFTASCTIECLHSPGTENFSNPMSRD